MLWQTVFVRSWRRPLASALVALGVCRATASQAEELGSSLARLDTPEDEGVRTRQSDDLEASKASETLRPGAPTPAEAPLVRLSTVQARGGGKAQLESGQQISLGLDAALQSEVERLLARAGAVNAAVIVAHVKTGQVLVWAERAKQGTVIARPSAPAASLFKIVTSAALLERTPVSPITKVCISGGLSGIERAHLEAPKAGKAVCGPFAQALGHSRNAAYAQLVTKHLSRADLLEMAERFGLNQQVSIDADIPVGTLELPAGDLDFARAAAGFQGSTLSPVGALSLALIIANGGQTVPLHLQPSPAVLPTSRRAIKPITARRLRRMMEITIETGTSRDAFHKADGSSWLPGVSVAGKTGTLQPSGSSTTSSWFTGFAPSRSPEIAVTVLLQNGKVWRRKANEVARDVLRHYFAKRGQRGVTTPEPDEA